MTAALAGFARRGVEATSLDDVAEAVGVRKQTILYWFGSKDVLIAGVAEVAIAELARTIESAAAVSARRGTEPWQAIIDAVLRLGANRPDLLVLLREVSRLGPSFTTVLVEAASPRLIRGAQSWLGPVASARELEIVRVAMLALAARVIAVAVEAELLEALGIGTDRAWLRHRRRDLLAQSSELIARTLTYRGLP